MAGKLPALNRRDAAAFLARFAPDHVAKAHNKVAGVNSAGKPFLIELDHDRGMRPDILAHALKYLDVPRDDFWAWYQGKR